MRVTQNMIAESFMRNMYQNLSRLGEKNDQISSQKRISRPSDDPVGAALAMRLRRQLAAMDQYKSNAEDAITWLKDTEAALTNTGDILHRLNDLTIQAANGTLTEEDRQTILHEVQELKDQLLQEANSTHVDRYLFSGYHVDKQPFIKNETGEIVLNPEINDVRILGVEGDAITDKNQFIIDEIEGLEPGKYKLEVDKAINFSVAKNREEEAGDSIAFDEVTIIQDTTEGNAKTTVILKNDDVEISFGLDDLNGSENPIEFTIGDDGNLNNGKVKIIKGELEQGTYTIRINDNNNNDKSTKIFKLYYEDKDVERNEVTNGFTLALTFKDMKITLNNTVTFEITPGDMNYHLGRNDLMPVNLQGPEVFEDIFKNVETLEEALKANDSSNLSGDVLKNIKGSLNHVLKYRSQVGARSKRLEMTVNKMESSYVDYTDLLSKTEDLDMAKAATELKMEESVYRAALAIGSRIIQPNLADFLS